MARISINRFGGIAPSIDPMDLGPDRAQTAQDLDPRYGDFRPLRGLSATSVATVTAGTKSLHRTTSGTWLSSTSVVDYVNAQIDDPSVERVFLTGRSAYPEAWQSSAYRRLGVRAPAAAPTLTLNEVDEYSTTEQKTSLNTWVQEIKDSILDNLTSGLLCNGTPTTGALGGIWLTHGAVAGMPTTVDTQIVYAVPLTAGAATNASNQYLLDPLLNGSVITYSSNLYWAIPITWRAYGYDIDESALATDIKAFVKPPENTEQMIPDAVADQFAARIGALANPALDPLALMIARVNSVQAEVALFLTRELTDPARVYGLSDILQRLATAIRSIDNYFINFNTVLGPVIDDYAYLVPAAVERLVETRAYRYTYVSDWLEESAPSEPSELLSLDQNDTVTITAVAPPTDVTYGATTHWRLYRSSTTNNGVAWQFVAETAIGTLTYTDDQMQEELQEVLVTETWTEPRAGMINLCGGPNGMMLGSVGNLICACEPDHPYAWPREYEIPVQNTIVAIVCVGQSWIVLTEGQNYLVSGSDSASLSALKLGQPQACVSKRGVALVEGGCLFPSPDGVCLADTGSLQLLTLGAYEKLDWAALTPSASFGAFSEGIYHLWLSTAGQRLSMDLIKASLTLTPYSGVTGAYTDIGSDSLYNVVSTTVKAMFGGSAQTAVYRTGVFKPAGEPSFAWILVEGDFASLTVRVYANGVLKRTVTVAGSVPKRMKALRAKKWEIEIEGNERAVRACLTTTAEELRWQPT